MAQISVGSQVQVILDYIVSLKYRETSHGLLRPKVQEQLGMWLSNRFCLACIIRPELQ